MLRKISPPDWFIGGSAMQADFLQFLCGLTTKLRRGTALAATSAGASC